MKFKIVSSGYDPESGAKVHDPTLEPGHVPTPEEIARGEDLRRPYTPEEQGEMVSGARPATAPLPPALARLAALKPVELEEESALYSLLAEGE